MQSFGTDNMPATNEQPDFIGLTKTNASLNNNLRKMVARLECFGELGRAGVQDIGVEVR